MSAGRGIAHSERTPQAARVAGAHVHGIQSWVALPDGHEDGEPTFVHHSASTLPTHVADGIEMTIIAGDAFGLRSPVVTLWPTLYVHAQIADGATVEVPANHSERAVYVVEGELAIGELPLTEGQLAVLAPGTPVMLRALGRARAMLLGGDPFPTPRFIWWNFVASSQERIERAKERWEQQQFPVVPGETEFIPLPVY
jgi:redox-sensitive bicupin YhaK (pirin superfamily)